MRLSKKLLLLFVALFLIVGGVSRYLFVVPDIEPPPLSGTLENHRLEIDGIDRSFDFYVPAELPHNAPVILALHPSQGDGMRMRRATAYVFDRLADEHGFIVAYPDGYERHWNDCRSAGSYAANQLDIDDIQFLRMLLAYLETEYAVDADSVLAFGLSNGGHMSYRLALEASGGVTAAAAIAAGMPAKENMDCAPAGEAVAMLIVNGTDDPINPYDGGEVALFGRFGSRGQVESSLDSARYWAALAGHTHEPMQLRLPDTVPEDESVAMLMAWSGAGGPDVSLITVYGGGHTIPHPTARFPRIFGRVNQDFSAAEEAWRFFRSEMDRRRQAVASD